MITLTQAERLVRRIAEVASQPASDTQTAKLAHDYAEVCRAANRRLEQCAIMIEAGQFLQALQLSETAPPLLDLITLLCFRQAAEWRAFCQAHQLPWTEPFYDKYIRLLNNAYGKGIASDHPFYRDYRRAVMENDDARAFSILRVISRLNPSDANTKEELKRLEEKLLRVKLESLRLVLDAGDPDSIEAGLEQLESSGLHVPASHPVWQRAQIARCQQMLRRAIHLRRQHLWQEVEGVVEEIHAVATRYNVRLPDADADAWTALEEWTTQQRANYVGEQDFRRAVSALEYEIKSIEERRASKAGLRRAEAAASFKSLTEKWSEADRFGPPLAEALLGRCHECGSWLQEQIQAASRRKRLTVILAAVVILGAVGAVLPLVLDKSRQVSYAQQLVKLEKDRKVAEVDNLFGEMPDSWKADPRMADSLAKARDFLAREIKLKENFIQQMKALQHISSAGFRSSLAQAGPARADCQRARSQLAPEYQAGANSALAAWDAQWQTFRNGELDLALRGAEEAAAVLNATNGVEAVRAAIPQVQDMLSGRAPLEAQPPPLDQALADRLGSLTNKIEEWTATVGKWDQAQAALSNAPSLEPYLEALDQLALSPFATLELRETAGKIDALQISQETLLGQLLLPGDSAAWPALTNLAGWNDTLMPEQPTSQEKDVYFKLRDDTNVQNVYVWQLTTNAQHNNPYHSHPVFVRGAIAPNNAGDEAGMVHDPAQYRDVLHFALTAYNDWDYIKVTLKYPTLECDCYGRLGLGDLIDANTGHYQKPILQLFDQLNRETNASPVFCAFVTFKLLAVAELRPREWGFQWCPALSKHIKELTALGAKTIQSGDWMVPDQVDRFEEPLQEYFAKARAAPLEKQARFLQRLTHDTCAQGFTFAGFADDSGHPVLRALDAPASELCGWSKAGSATVLFRKAAGAEGYAPQAEPLPYSPLFVFNGNRRELLLQILSDTGYPAALASPVLPPFFQGVL